MACMLAGLLVPGLGFDAGRAAAAPFVWRPVHESIVIDANTGRVLSENNADAMTYPASLTKMMTLYLTFKALNEGRIHLDTRLPVSVRAASQPPTKLYLRPGDTVSVKSLILGIVTRSANDAAVVLAEGLAGSEPDFAEKMDVEARRLGMLHTSFLNASGLPNPAQQTTARDMARLALALYRDFPRECRFFATREFNFRGTEIVGHDHLLNWYPGADGIKTGFIGASGYNLATSAVRDGYRLIGVVLGGTSWAARDREMAALLDHDFARLGVAASAVARAAPHPAARSMVTVKAMTLVLRPEPLSPKRLLHAASEVGAGWSIQLAAFRAESAAQRAARTAAGLPSVRGRQLEILPVAGQTRPEAPLYRARVLHFTKKDAESACAALHEKRKPCLFLQSVRAASAAAGWDIQVGAFALAGAARKAARTAVGLLHVRGKPVQVVQPAGGAKPDPHLFRVRFLRFGAADAEKACAALRKRRIPCTVVAPVVRVARQ